MQANCNFGVCIFPTDWDSLTKQRVMELICDIYYTGKTDQYRTPALCPTERKKASRNRSSLHLFTAALIDKKKTVISLCPSLHLTTYQLTHSLTTSSSQSYKCSREIEEVLNELLLLCSSPLQSVKPRPTVS